MIKKITYATLGLVMLGAAPALADGPRIYAYGGENNCPSGLQPITIDGVICCGTPNQSVSYQSMKAHPLRRARTVGTTRRYVQSTPSCPIGTKGCSN